MGGWNGKVEGSVPPLPAPAPSENWTLHIRPRSVGPAFLSGSEGVGSASGERKSSCDRNFDS